MKNLRDAFAGFWSGFTDAAGQPLRAYPSGYGVLPLPYITYDLSRPAFGDFTVLTGRVWTRSTSWGMVDDVLAQAAERVPEGGVMLDLGGDGAVMLYRSNPFCDYMPPEDGDEMNKAGVIRLIIKNYVI